MNKAFGSTNNTFDFTQKAFNLIHNAFSFTNKTCGFTNRFLGFTNTAFNSLYFSHKTFGFCKIREKSITFLPCVKHLHKIFRMIQADCCEFPPPESVTRSVKYIQGVGGQDVFILHNCYGNNFTFF